MSKDLNFSVLLDFYGTLLTPRQSDIMNLYYNEDLSLAEIAEDIGITRQGVRDAIKKSEHILTETEHSLGLVERFKLVESKLEDIKEKLKNHEDFETVIKTIDEINLWEAEKYGV